MRGKAQEGFRGWKKRSRKSIGKKMGRRKRKSMAVVGEHISNCKGLAKLRKKKRFTSCQIRSQMRLRIIY